MFQNGQDALAKTVAQLRPAFETLNVHRGGSGSTAGTATASSHCTRRLYGRRFDTLPRSVEESLGELGEGTVPWRQHGKRQGVKEEDSGVIRSVIVGSNK